MEAVEGYRCNGFCCGTTGMCCGGAGTNCCGIDDENTFGGITYARRRVTKNTFPRTLKSKSFGGTYTDMVHQSFFNNTTMGPDGHPISPSARTFNDGHVSPSHTLFTQESNYENGSSVCGGIMYAFLMIPSWLEPWSWFMLSVGILLSIPHFIYVPSPGQFSETMYFTLIITLLTSLLQELWLQTEYRFCRGCRGNLPHWKKWGPFYCILISLGGFISEPVVHLIDVAWRRHDCGIVFFKQPFSVDCAIKHVAVDYFEAANALRASFGLFFLWTGIVWATDIFNNFLGDYLDARMDQVYSRVKNEQNYHSSMSEFPRGNCVC